MNKKFLWWQKGIIYQIYPRSYQDSTGNGIGDLWGVINRLDYIKDLGVDAIWFSPINPSPFKDFGYDVSDYCGVHELYGGMGAFKKLLSEAHTHGLKVIIDLVPNHSSDQHEWFKESRASRDNPKRDWYIWRDPAPDGGVPNNYLSFFGGPAWTFDEKTGQYYMHQFVPEQPELNYRNPEVRQAMLDVMDFWMKMGVDGFRVDVIWLMMKDPELRDNPPNPDWDGFNPRESLLPKYTANLPEVHDLIKDMRAVLDRYDERFMVGEIYLPNDQLMMYYGDNDECHLPYNFQLILKKWEAKSVRETVDQYEADLPKGAWPNWVMGNHDRHRIATRIGIEQARVANMMLLTLRGTLTTYYGEELGMTDTKIPPEFVQDPSAVNQPEIADIVGRDPERTPMQWDNSPNAGFSAEGVQTWLPVNENYTSVNTVAEAQDPASFLNLYKALTTLRRAESALHVGSYQSVDAGDDDIFAYLRRAEDGTTFLIVLNFSNRIITLDLSSVALKGEIVASTDMISSGPAILGALIMAENQGLVLKV
ncbi:MAG: alpha-glucosidase C-terminal domain-containing protein [Anaerolineaceae bacterium]|nr:alpha-glucosidase C-terminal domain-containing protein [Anaerolineaceae bacterium]